jgi:hypothetical protein
MSFAAFFLCFLGVTVVGYAAVLVARYLGRSK